MQRKEKPSVYNPMAQALSHGLFRAKRIKNKKAYTRKGRRKGNHNTDSPFESIRELFRES